MGKKRSETIPEGVDVPMCCCGYRCKLVKSQMLGDRYDMRWFMCANYEYDPSGAIIYERHEVVNEPCLSFLVFLNIISNSDGGRLSLLYVILRSGSTQSSPRQTSGGLRNNLNGWSKGGGRCTTRKKRKRSTRSFKRGFEQGVSALTVRRMRKERSKGSARERVHVVHL
jgi:hypothetical protein